MVRRSRKRGLVLAIALTVLVSTGLALVAVITGVGGMFGPRTPPAGRLSGLSAADATTRPTPATGPTGPAPTHRSVSPRRSVTGSGLIPVSPPAVPEGVPTVPPAEPDQPNLVHRGNSTLTCPSGIVPMVQIQGATFTPALEHGTSFGVGRYTIKVRGRVANETSAAIQLRSLQITVGGRPWRRTTATTAVTAQNFAPITFEGTYDSPAPHRAVVDSRLRWQWQAPGLRPCGEEGLVEDD
jgi:hypothetical protein